MTLLLTLFISHAETKSIEILFFKRKPIERTQWLVWLSVFYFCLFLFFVFVFCFCFSFCLFFSLHDTYINYIKVPFTRLSTYIALHYLLTVLLRHN